jgi:ankyrin repeat protein
MDEWFNKEQLHFAVQDNDLDRVRELVEAGADPNLFDDLGKTPLHYACKNENFTIAEYLIEHGADVNAHHEASIGNTPLGDVAGACSFKMAEFLLRHGADPSIRGWMQLNAIDRAKRRKKAEGKRVSELLLSTFKT